VEVEDAELILVGFGIMGRIARSAIEEGRRKGLKIGLIRPLTLWPFPEKAFLELPAGLRSILVVEGNAGQMLEDVKLSVNGRIPVEFFGKLGGQTPTVSELLRLSGKLIRRGCD
jgi:2-oxoglutarate ferredoxin oxidoreductase subunit alpha